MIKEVLRAWLALYELDVESATNETEARRTLERGGGECILIFTETDLQSGRGEDLYQKLADAFPSPPCWVFLYGSRKPQIPQRPGHGEPLVIRKPFSHNAFSNLIRKYVRG